ncbi:MAG: NAD-binding protein [Candidatus Binatia bacterium]
MLATLAPPADRRRDVGDRGIHHHGADATAHRRSPVLFEAVSAFGTVGLSMNPTPLLPDGAKLVLAMALMFAGRLRPAVADGLLPAPAATAAGAPRAGRADGGLMAQRRIAVIGLSAFGSTLVRELARRRVAVLAVDRDPAQVDAVRDVADEAVIADAADRRALEALRLNDYASVVLSLGASLDASLLAVLHLRDLKVHRSSPRRRAKSTAACCSTSAWRQGGDLPEGRHGRAGRRADARQCAWPARRAPARLRHRDRGGARPCAYTAAPSPSLTLRNRLASTSSPRDTPARDANEVNLGEPAHHRFARAGGVGHLRQRRALRQAREIGCPPPPAWRFAPIYGLRSRP